MSPYPLTFSKVALAGALLKAGGYRSAGAYLGALKRRHMELDHPWSDCLTLAVKDALRSCPRGWALTSSVRPLTCVVWQESKNLKLSLAGHVSLWLHCSAFLLAERWKQLAEDAAKLLLRTKKVPAEW